MYTVYVWLLLSKCMYSMCDCFGLLGFTNAIPAWWPQMCLSLSSLHTRHSFPPTTHREKCCSESLSHYRINPHTGTVKAVTMSSLESDVLNSARFSYQKQHSAYYRICSKLDLKKTQWSLQDSATIVEALSDFYCQSNGISFKEEKPLRLQPENFRCGVAIPADTSVSAERS